MDKSETKICNKCKKELNISEFWKNKYNKDGLVHSCKECSKKYNKKLYETDENTQNRRKEYAKKWYQENKEKYNEKRKGCSKENIKNGEKIIKKL
jgi:hypothetical protein